MILVSAGHHPESQGASWGEFTEYPEACIWATEILKQLRFIDMQCGFVPVGKLREKVRFINNMRATVAVEIHFNADPRNGGRGSETLFCPGSQLGKALADQVQSALGGVMAPDRGHKEGWYQMDPKQGPDYFLNRTNCPAIIVEPEFVHNVELIQMGRVNACTEIARALAEFVRAEHA